MDLLFRDRDEASAPGRKRIRCWKEPDPEPTPFVTAEVCTDEEGNIEESLLEEKPDALGDIGIERLCSRISVQDIIREDADMITATSETQNDQHEVCICPCSRQFAPYKRGAITIKKICPIVWIRKMPVQSHQKTGASRAIRVKSRMLIMFGKSRRRNAR